MAKLKKIKFKLKKKNEHEVLVICSRSKKMFFKDLKKISGKFLVTQGSFFDSKSGNPVTN